MQVMSSVVYMYYSSQNVAAAFYLFLETINPILWVLHQNFNHLDFQRINWFIYRCSDKFEINVGTSFHFDCTRTASAFGLHHVGSWFCKKRSFFWFRNWYITIVHLWWGQLSMDFSAGSVFYFRFGFSQLDCCKQLVAPCKVVRVCRWEIVGSWLLMVIPVTPSLATTMNIEQRPDID